MTDENINQQKFSDFYENYKNLVSQNLSEIENFRLSEVKKYRLTILFAFVLPMLLLIVAAIFGYICSDYGKDWQSTANLVFALSFALFIGFGILGTTALIPLYKQWLNKKFKNKVKLSFMQKILDSVYKIRWINHIDYDFDNDYIIKEEEAYDSGLFLPYHRNEVYRLDDELSGSYKGIDYTISEGKQTYFPYVLISVKFNKTIKNRTIVYEKSDLTEKHKLLYLVLSIFVFIIGICIIIYSLTPTCPPTEQTKAFIDGLKSLFASVVAASLYLIEVKKKKEPLKTVKLEDVKFMKRFNIDSSDQVEARYLVTPAFMERFYNLKTVFGTGNIKCSFYNDRLMIAIQNRKDLFELCDLYTSLYDTRHIKKFYDQINSIFQIIDYFKLNEKTGL